MACPAAPLIRLSMTDTTMTRPVFRSAVKPMSQKLDPRMEDMLGKVPGSQIRTKYSPS